MLKLTLHKKKSIIIIVLLSNTAKTGNKFVYETIIEITVNSRHDRC